jgi:hypothetical protein
MSVPSTAKHTQRPMTITLRTLFLSAAIAAPAFAQQPNPQPPQSRAERFLRDCEDGWGMGDRNRERFCEVRDATVKAPESRLFVEPHTNGSVRLYGWDRNEVLVRSLIQSWAETREDARAVAREVRVVTDADRIRSDGPSSRRYTGWSVSYEIWVPRKTNIDAGTRNGSILAEGIEGRLYLDAVNGSISLRNLAGDVRAETSNGSVSAVLNGTSWRGGGLDLTSTNGSVTLDIPDNFNADLETGTVNGGLHVDFPITIQGSLGRRISTKLGTGGPRVRAVTTNGSVRIRRPR